jgi:sRNA-binding protein
MSEVLNRLRVGSIVKVIIANSPEVGTVTEITEEAVLIQLHSNSHLIREVSFEDFVELGYEIIR